MSASTTRSMLLAFMIGFSLVVLASASLVPKQPLQQGETCEYFYLYINVSEKTIECPLEKHSDFELHKRFHSNRDIPRYMMTRNIYRLSSS